MRDYIDRLTTSENETMHQAASLNFLGIPMVRAMAVAGRAASPEEMEASEAALIASYKTGAVELPITWWDQETGAPEPLRDGDFALLEAAGITPEEWMICVIEEQLERGA